MWTPLWAALAGLVTNATVGWLLLPLLAQGSIALGNSLGVGIQVGLLLLVAWLRLKGIEARALVISLGRTLAASGLMAIAVVGFRTLLPELGSRLTGVGGLGIGATVYTLAATLLGSEEIRQLPGLLLRRDQGFRDVTGTPT
jgi:peptidoglycan biosynthesis protein MviN/MurJ (putative lipid II flippase)